MCTFYTFIRTYLNLTYMHLSLKNNIYIYMYIGSFYNLIDIYALSNYMHNQRFITQLYGIWNEKNGLQIFNYLINKYNIKYHRRSNFNEFTLKGVTVVCEYTPIYIINGIYNIYKILKMNT